MPVDKQEAVIQLLYLAEERRTVLLELAHKPWMQDDLSATENQAVVLLASIAGADAESAEQVVRMPFLGSIEMDDLSILQTLEDLDGEGLRWVLSHPSLDGAHPDVLPATMALAQLEWKWPEAAETLRSLPWLEDGVTPAEVNAVLALRELALDSRALFRALVSKAWTEDGLNRDEISVVSALRGMAGLSNAKRDESVSLRLAAMPFLVSVDGVDAAAAASLSRLFWASDEEDYLMRVLAHATLEDGISNDEAFLVAALGIVVEDRPYLLDTLLELGTDAVEKRIIQLPLAGEMALSVLNVNPGSYSTMDILEQALRAQEAFMDVPLPTSYVGLLVADATAAGGGGGPSGLITVDPAYAEDDYIIAHELAHIYWAFPPPWIAEGGAEFMTTVSVDKQFTSDACGWADSLSDLDSASRQSPPAIDLSNCAYVLGRGLFLDLYETLGDEAFRSGFGRLYVAMRDDELYDECTGLELGLCYVRSAFVTDASSEPTSLAEPVIDRWYYGPRQ